MSKTDNEVSKLEKFAMGSLGGLQRLFEMLFNAVDADDEIDGTSKNADVDAFGRFVNYIYDTFHLGAVVDDDASISVESSDESEESSLESGSTTGGSDSFSYESDESDEMEEGEISLDSEDSEAYEISDDSDSE